MDTTNLDFVMEVKKYELLYNPGHSGYTRKDASERAWKAIGKKFNLSVSEAKAKWKNIRNSFVRNLKTSKSEGRKSKKPYYMYDAVKFILPYLKANFIENLSDNDDDGVTIKTEATTEMPSSGPSTSTNHPIKIEARSRARKSKFLIHTNIVPQQQQHHQQQQQQASDSTPISMPPMIIIEDHPKPQAALDLLSAVASSQRVKRLPEEQTEYEMGRTEEFAVKKSRIDEEKTESIKLFLMSLIPDLQELSNAQLRKFKQGTLQLIDDISEVSHTYMPIPTTYDAGQYSLCKGESYPERDSQQ